MQTITEKLDGILQMKHGLFEIRGPAGSGKTYQLISSINFLQRARRNGFIISYSNAAVDELIERLGSNFTGKIMTSHAFCWIWIKRSYATFLKDSGFVWNTGFKNVSFSIENISTIKYSSFGKSSYDELGKTLFLSHQQVLDLFSKMLIYSTDMQGLMKSTIDYVLIDEYQDTHRSFIESIVRLLRDEVLIGVYGDPMQNIYQKADDPRTGDIQCIGTDLNKSIVLNTNYRSDQHLVQLFNLYRRDHIKQSADSESQGCLYLIMIPKKLNIDLLSKIKNKIKIDDLEIIALTHATRLQAYLDTEFNILKKVKKAIDNVIPGEGYIDWSDLLNTDSKYAEKQLLEFLIDIGTGKFSVRTINRIREIFRLKSNDTFPFEELKIMQKIIISMKFAQLVDQKLDEFGKFLSSLQKELKDVDFDNLQKSLALVKHNNSDTIFGSKGKEYKNVLLNIDNGGWQDMNWNDISSRIDLQNLFYVGITRAKSNLIVFVNTTKSDNRWECRHEEFAEKLIEKWHEQKIKFKLIELSE